MPAGQGSAPRVSVLISCYNLGAFLDEAVESVLRQTLQDFEILIIDDGSTDEQTRRLVTGYDRPRCRVICTPHQGLAHARNTGIAEAEGTYVCALDADDRLDPEFLTKTVAALDADDSLTFVSTWLRAFGDEEWDWTPERCDLQSLLSENTVLTAALVRREALLAIGGYDVGMPVQGDEDWDLWLTLVERGYRGTILPEVLFHYRRRPGSMSTVCWHGPGHLPLAEYRFTKHSDSYTTQLIAVLLGQDAEVAALLKRNDELERYLGTELEPAFARRQNELATLRTRLASLTDTPREGSAAAAAANLELPVATSALDDRVAHLEAALGAASNEVIALRTSGSWRITRPLRDIYGWWLRRTGSR